MSADFWNFLYSGLSFQCQWERDLKIQLICFVNLRVNCICKYIASEPTWEMPNSALVSCNENRFRQKPAHMRDAKFCFVVLSWKLVSPESFAPARRALVANFWHFPRVVGFQAWCLFSENYLCRVGFNWNHQCGRTSIFWFIVLSAKIEIFCVQRWIMYPP